MTGTPRAPWTPEQDKELRALVLSANSVDTIAKALNRTTFAVRRRASRGRMRRGNSRSARFVSLSQPNKRSLCPVGHLDRRSVVNGNIFNSKGVHVGVVTGAAVFGLKGQKLYDLKGSNIYKLNGDLVGHLLDARGEKKRLDKATDKLFPEG